MSLRKKPIRGPRALYKLDTILVNVDEDPLVADAAPAKTVGGLKRPILIKMKEAIGDFLGLKVVAWNDPIFTGTFPDDTGAAGANKAQTGATNSGAKYRKNLGGFREASYTLIAKTKFVIPEIVLEDDGYKTVNSDYASITIGFPKGHSVTEVLAWLATTSRFSQIRAVRTPAGKLIHLGSAT